MTREGKPPPFNERQLAELQRLDGVTRFICESAYEYGYAVGRAELKLKGKADTVFKLLLARGFVLTAEQREYVLQCKEEALIEKWIERVLFAGSLDEVLAD